MAFQVLRKTFKSVPLICQLLPLESSTMQLILLTVDLCCVIK